MAVFTLSAAGLLFDVLEGSLAMAQHGCPVATLELPEDTAPTVGPATLLVVQGDDAPLAFVGTLVFAHADGAGRCSVSWVGGVGGLGGAALALHYTASASQVALGTVVGGILAGAGELAAAGALDSLAGLELPRWTRMAGETWAQALTRALDGTGRTWRVLDTGEVWIGEETWPELVLEGEQLDEDRGDRAVPFRWSRASARPGTTFGARRVVRVTFLAAGDGILELDDDASGARALARLLAPGDPYSRIYLAEVVTQNADETLDLRLIRDEGAPWAPLPFEELTRVPFDTGVQGARYVLPVGGYVRVAFAGASPASAWAFGRPTSAAANKGVARLGDHCNAGTLTMTGGPGGLVIVYQPPGTGSATTSVLTGTVGSDPVVFAGAVTIQLEAVIDTASEEVLLQ